MTVIVAIEENGKLYFGGDSFCGDLNSGAIDLCDAPKVYRAGDVLVGICGSVKCEQILEACAKKWFPGRKVTREWIQNEFCAILMKEMDRNGALVSPKEGAPEMPDESSFLLGVNGEILILQEDFSIFRSTKKFASLGTGAPYARGALRVLSENKTLAPEEKAMAAMNVAEEFCAFVRAPFHIISQ